MANAKTKQSISAGFEKTKDEILGYILDSGLFGSKLQGDSDECIILEQFDNNLGIDENVTFQLNLTPFGRSILNGEQWQGTRERFEKYEGRLALCRFRETLEPLCSKDGKSTLGNTRNQGKAVLCETIAQATDALILQQLTGEKGIAQPVRFHDDYLDIHMQKNALYAPDPMHHILSCDNRSRRTFTKSDKLSMNTIKSAINQISRNRLNHPEFEVMRPLRIGSSKFYVLVVHPYQKFDLFQDIGDQAEFKLKENLCQSEANDNLIAREAVGLITGDFGMIDGLILHSNVGIVIYKGGANSDVNCAAGLILGRQAGMIAYGGYGFGKSILYSDKTTDFGKRFLFSIEFVMGVNKCQFRQGSKKYDCGIMRIDTAANEPTP